MEKKSTSASIKTYACETCAARAKAEANPRAFMSRLWKWHTGWCPGWKAYQAHLSAQGSAAQRT